MQGDEWGASGKRQPENVPEEPLDIDDAENHQAEEEHLEGVLPAQEPTVEQPQTVCGPQGQRSGSLSSRDGKGGVPGSHYEDEREGDEDPSHVAGVVCQRATRSAH